MKYITRYRKMKSKISLNIDVDKLDKKRFVVRAYKNKDGESVTVREMKLEVVPLKESKVLVTGDGWTLTKVGFVVETPTKKEKEDKTKTTIVGDATQFTSEEINPEDIPF